MLINLFENAIKIFLNIDVRFTVIIMSVNSFNWGYNVE